MIYVINYDKSKRKQLYAKLDALRQPFEIGTNEIIALKSDKIILPDTAEPFSALRKLHFYNLHSALRMFPCPILGIGVGFLLMLKKCEQKACFSFFPYVANFDEKTESWKIKTEEGNLVKKRIFKNGKYFGVINQDDSAINEAIIEFVNY